MEKVQTEKLCRYIPLQPERAIQTGQGRMHLAMQPVLLGLTFVDLNAAWIHNQWYSPKTKFQICEKVKFYYMSILKQVVQSI